MLILYLIRLARIISENYDNLDWLIEDDDERRWPRLYLDFVFKIWVILDNFMMKYIGLRHDIDEGIYLHRPERGFHKEDYEDIKHFNGNWTSFHENLTLLAAQEQVWHYMLQDTEADIQKAVSVIRRHKVDIEEESQNE